MESKNVAESNVETEALSVLSLLGTVIIQSQERRHPPLNGYMCVWGIYGYKYRMVWSVQECVPEAETCEETNKTASRGRKKGDH